MKNIDIIVPIYNAYEFTEECIKSVIRNTDLNKHTLVLINDKSPDEKILPMLLKYREQYQDKKIVVLDNEENMGFVKTVNKGMQYSIRAYITLDNGEKVYGDAVTKVAVPQAYIDKIQKVSGNKCKITWKKISGASGYTIYRTSNEGKTLKKIKTVGKNTTSYTVKRSYMDTNKKGIVVIANKVKIGKKKYNSNFYNNLYI